MCQISQVTQHAGVILRRLLVALVSIIRRMWTHKTKDALPYLIGNQRYQMCQQSWIRDAGDELRGVVPRQREVVCLVQRVLLLLPLEGPLHNAED